MGRIKMKTKIFLMFLSLLVIIGNALLIGGCGKNLGVSNLSTSASLLVAPETGAVSVGSTQQFRINGYVTGSAVTTAEVSWRVIGAIGTIDATGLFTATAEGMGTIEAKVGALEGWANVTVTGGKTIIGQVKDIILPGNIVSSAVIMAGNRITTSGSDGRYRLMGVSPSVETISAAVPGFVSTTVQSTATMINIPMGFPAQTSSYYYDTVSTMAKGRLVDVNGNAIKSTNLSLVFWDANYTTSSSGYTDDDGGFSTTVRAPKNIASISGYIMVVKEIGGIYKGAI